MLPNAFLLRACEKKLTFESNCFNAKNWKGVFASMKQVKRFLCLIICVLLVVATTQPAYAGSASATGSVKAIINSYTVTAKVSVTSSSYSASTTYATTADSVKVSITIVQVKKSTGAKVASRTDSSSGTTKASISGSAGSTYAFYSATSKHTVATVAETWTKSLGTVYA